MKGHKGHHHRHPRAEHARGGQVGHFDKDASPTDVYAGAGSNVVKEAKQRKAGGKAMGGKSAMRADRAPRKSGGRAGSNMNPLSSAHAGTEPKGHKSYEAERN
jgi:hypothetical protein